RRSRGRAEEATTKDTKTAKDMKSQLVLSCSSGSSWLRGSGTRLVRSSGATAEFKDFVIWCVERVTPAAREHEMPADDEQLAVERGDVHAVARCRERGQAIPVIRCGVEHLNIAQGTFDVIVPLLAAYDVDLSLVGRPALPAAC